LNKLFDIKPSDIKAKSGIYKIYTPYNGKCYVGSAVDIANRIRTHKCQLRKNEHHSSYLQRVFNKRGEGVIRMDLLEALSLDNFDNVMDFKDFLLKREQFFIDYLDSYNNGYNSVGKANSTLGFKMPEKAVSLKFKPVSQYTYDGVFIRSFQSIKEASILTKTKRGDITSTLKMRQPTANGYIWKYFNEGDSGKKVKPTKRRSGKKEVPVVALSEKSKHPVIFKSLAQASLFFDKNISSNVKKAIDGETKSAYGCKWLKFSEYRLTKEYLMYSAGITQIEMDWSPKQILS
jgi:group I intron endonuclease